MTAEATPNPQRSFTRDRLPWLIGIAALVLYLITLNRWVTLTNLALVNRVSGWDWQPMLSQPLLYAVTLPFRLLPPGWVPPALNLFTAVCGALTLMNLARSVALLPHNRVEAQRLLVPDPVGLLSQPNAWLPVVLAAAALGLELTFWEHSIAASGEMLDLLLFAYVIRCLLEHRLREQQSWLDRAAVVFGLGMANNWGMAAFLPVFVLTVLRTKRLSFFNLRTVQRIDRDGWEKAKPSLRMDLRFFLRMTLFWLAGLSLFLLQPLVQALSPNSVAGFWEALRTAATGYESTLHLMSRVFLRGHRDLFLLLLAGSLLPVFLLSIRWGSLSPREGPGQIDLAAYILHVAHAFLLLVCLWLMFDPPFSPRQIARQNGIPLNFLSLYYLTAVSIGYYCGFFLLLFGPAALQSTSRRHPMRRILCRTVPIVVYLLALITVAGLPLVNLRAIRAANAPHLERFAKLSADSLPADGAVVCSDDPARLAIVFAELAREGKSAKFVPVEAASLPLKNYRAWLSRNFPERVPASATEPVLPLAPLTPSAPDGKLDGFGVAQVLTNLSQHNHVYWLQPSLGPWLNLFYLQPRGLVHEMRPYLPVEIGAPPLTTNELAENLTFWKGAIETAVNPVLQLVSVSELPRPEFERELMTRGHLRTPPPPQIRVLAWWYSGALNRWGVTLQRNGQWSNATPCFTLARDLKPENFPASINLQCNSNLLAHQKMRIGRNPDFEEQTGKYKNLYQALAENGPLDDPTYCSLLAVGFARGGMLRQGLQEMGRACELVPEDTFARMTLGDFFVTARLPELALQVVGRVQSDPRLQPLGTTNEMELALLEARAWYALTNRGKAEGIIYALLALHPNDSVLRERAVATFMANQSYSQALRVTDRQLNQCPDDLNALIQKGNLCILSGNYSNAIPVLTHLLSLTNIYNVRLNRSFAYMRTSQFDAAEADCRELLQSFPDSYRTYRALGDIAQQRKDTNAAIRYYEQYLARAETQDEEARTIAAQLQQLRQARQ